ncbi:MAG TPA: hypothetical protein VFI13_14045 [Gemmatimonadales bacterium]|nr:hypothetical protein [Gemmatimonadales bacterium]
MHDPFELVGVFFSVGFSVLALYGGWIGVRWAHRKLDGPRAPDAETLDGLADRLARLEETEHRLAEVEERLDFTERMLAEGRAPTALPRGDR